MGRPSEQVAIVTGGAGDVGAAVARTLAAEGAAVVVADIRDDEGAQLTAGLGVRARFTHLDVTSEDDWQRALVGTEQTLGRSRSSSTSPGSSTGHGGTEPRVVPPSPRRQPHGRLAGHARGGTVAAPGWGRCDREHVLYGRADRLRRRRSLRGEQRGLRGLTKAAAPELAPDRVRVCSVHPGAIRTRMTAGFGDAHTAAQPIPRFGEPEEVARMVLFIITEATFSTGSEFVMDGGILAGSPADLASGD